MLSKNDRPCSKGGALIAMIIESKCERVADAACAHHCLRSLMWPLAKSHFLMEGKADHRLQTRNISGLSTH